MKSDEILTNLDSMSSQEEAEIIYMIYHMINALIEERVPQIVNEEIRKSKEEMEIKIITKLNGKNIEMNEVIDKIAKELVKK